MRYEPLFNLNLRHDYYPDERCPDFTIVPTAEGTQLLQNHRLVLKTVAGGVSVFVPVRDGQPLIAVEPQTIFRFYLRLEQSGFHTITDTEQTIASSGVALYGPTFAPSFRDVFALTEGKATADEALLSFPLSEPPRAGTRAEDFMLPGGEAQVVAYQPATRTVVVDPGEQPGDEIQIEYPLGLPRDVFARVDCSYTESGQTFTVDFIAWAVPWTYWLIPADVGTQLSVELIEPDIALATGAPITLKIADPNVVAGDHFPSAIRERLDGDLSRCTALVSQKPVPYRKKYQKLPRVRVTTGEDQASELKLAPPPPGARTEQFIQVGQPVSTLL